MTNEFEYINYSDTDQLTMLENTAIPGGVLGDGGVLGQALPLLADRQRAQYTLL